MANGWLNFCGKNAHDTPQNQTMASGITGTDECVTEYEKFKLQNGAGNREKRAFLIFRIKDEKIVLCETGSETASWSDFVETMSSNPKDGAYGIYDFKVKTPDERLLQKIIFVAWAPDSGLPIKAKMIYAAAREPFKQQLGSGLAYVIQATDMAELDEKTIADMVVKGR
ncbi:hypothetical protein BASA81_002531 [Batrachochytrium salamandrivorans]|nr:hypothetical protein BASA81_002531 [Batrachochytrium salamandrivorans]